MSRSFAGGILEALVGAALLAVVVGERLVARFRRREEPSNTVLLVQGEVEPEPSEDVTREAATDDAGEAETTYGPSTIVGFGVRVVRRTRPARTSTTTKRVLLSLPT